MTVDVAIVRRSALVRTTSEGSQEIDGNAFFRYDRLVECLGAAPGIRAALVNEASEQANSVVLDYSADRLAGSPGHGLILGAERNGFLPIVRHHLLGAVTADAMERWRAGTETVGADTLVGWREVAERLGAVDHGVLGLPDLCYVFRPDWTSLPAALAAYITAAVS